MQSIYKLTGNKRNKPQPRGPTNVQGPNTSFVSEKETVPESPLRPLEGDWSCKKEDYRYPIDSEGTPKDPWERCYDAVSKNDEALCQDVYGEITSLLVVASLFLAIVTAFTIESFKWLKPDSEEAMVVLLGDIVRLLNDTNARGTAPNRTQSTFVPNNHDIVVNQLWFLSMTLSLSAVVVGTLCLQWLAAFRRTDVKHKPHDDALALRQLRYEGFISWGVTRVPAILLLTVQGALVLFAIGLLYLLWSANKRVALPVAIVSGVSVVLLTLTTVMPLLQSVIGWIIPLTLAIPQCPYKSPISWVVHRGAVLLSLIVTFPCMLVPYIRKKMGEWRRQQFGLLTDYLWQEYDDLRRRQRESWGPQSSKTGSDKYSYYLVHGLASAMDTLVFQPSSVHIIHKCLQDFHGTSAEVETFEDLFRKDFNPAEEALLKAEYSSSSVTSRGDKHLSIPSQHLDTLRRDFLNAIVESRTCLAHGVHIAIGDLLVEGLLVVLKNASIEERTVVS
ncbi:hypothetical protein P691DRAFT_715263 [Macrolepiota fuliginosa MF-IS2]|uniref:DUF6535 domain-containing protein n=1 Tax=Macrolepiota fuliginosa MF-IS2 TaxID=1400762 RepID=A0A9P5WZ97_9AGAR|nr:hypothetical protein P691DRAFT_715263 [Macrolepiota fuliginosa MF-IS2]